MTTLQGPPLAEAAGIGALTMSGFLDEVCERFAGNEALVFDDPLRGRETERWTYADLRREARRVGKALVATGIGKGNRVGILMGNRPEAVASLFGAAMAGAVAVPLSTFSPKPELAFLFQHSDASIVLTQTALLGRRFADDARELCGPSLPSPQYPFLRRLVSVGDGVPDGVQAWDEFLDEGDAVDDAVLDARIAQTSPADHGLIIYSSGTTSQPKGVLHNHRSPTLQFWVQADIFLRHERTRMWTALPMFWTAGLNTAMGSTLATGGCWVMQESFEPGEAIALMAREGVTEPYALPHQLAALEEHPDWATADLSSVTCAFGKSALARHPKVEPDPGWNMPVGYGLSETCAFFVAHRADAGRDAMKRSIGRLLPGNELRVVDPDTGRVLGPNEDGELLLRGPTLMEHYVKKTREESVDADGFFATGDVGFFDDAGEVHFTGRRTEMIKTGGANVSPAELEVALRACKPVKLARIIGVPDPRLDQLVVACIVLQDGLDATEDDIRSFLRERVAAYKVPKRVLFFADGEIPMTGSGTKVRDQELAALVEKRLGQEPVPSKTGES